MLDSALSEATRDRLIKAIMDMAWRFNVLVLGIRMEKRGLCELVVIQVECEIGEKAGSFSLQDNELDYQLALIHIKQILGDWTE